MKQKLFFSSLTMFFLIISCNLFQADDVKNIVNTTNLNGTITIQGKVIDEDTNLAPEGITSINISNKWRWQVPIPGVPKNGENEKVFVDNNGYYSITISKGDTIQMIPTKLLYKTNLHNYQLTNLDKNQTINFIVKKDSTLYKELLQTDSRAASILKTYLNSSNPEKLITVAGTFRSKSTNKPIKNVSVGVFGINNTTGAMTFHMTDKNGQFSIQVPENSIFILNPATYNSKYFKVVKDTIINTIQ